MNIKKYFTNKNLIIKIQKAQSFQFKLYLSTYFRETVHAIFKDCDTIIKST